MAGTLFRAMAGCVQGDGKPATPIGGKPPQYPATPRFTRQPDETRSLGLVLCIHQSRFRLKQSARLELLESFSTRDCSVPYPAAFPIRLLVLWRTAIASSSATIADR